MELPANLLTPALLTEIRNLNTQLEERVRERTAQLERANLALSQEMVQRERVEEELRRSEERYRVLVAATASVVWLSDPKGKLLTPNAAWASFTGQPWPEYEGLGWMAAYHPDDRAGFWERWEQACERRSYCESEARLWHAPTGGYRHTVIRAVPLTDAEENVREWIGTVTDVEERVHAEEVARKNFELEEQNRRVEESNRLKSEFVANMSHELRTPLNSIIGFSEFLVDERPGPLNARQKEYLGDVLTSARHLLRLINDVLDLSKVEAGRMELHPELFPLAPAVEEVGSILRMLAQRKNITLSTEVAPDAGSVTLDPRRFKQVLYNLLSNAVKFTNDGGSVAVAAGRHDGDRVFVRVTDTGIGIRREDQARLFMEFQQLDSGPARRYEGTGLGLVLTRKIVELHGGEISVESEMGKGSAFTVTWPVAARGGSAA